MEEEESQEQVSPQKVVTVIEEESLISNEPLDNSDNDEWLITFSDMITLLLIFFVLMFSVTKLDGNRYKEVSSTIKRNLNKSGSGKHMSDPINAALASLTSLVNQNNLGSHVKVAGGFGVMTIELKSHSLFDSGSATIKPNMKTTLGDLVKVIKKLPKGQFNIEIEGHTDSSPIHSYDFYSNWELSSRRAVNVLHVFTHHGISRKRMRIIAYADTHPKVVETGEEDDETLAEIRSQNRRIVIRISPKR